MYLESCCQAKYNTRKEAIEDEMKKEANYLKKDEPDVFSPNTCGRYQQFLWDLMEKPDTSIAAKVRRRMLRDITLIWAFHNPPSYVTLLM